MRACVSGRHTVVAFSLWQGWIEVRPIPEPLDGMAYRVPVMSALAAAVEAEYGVSVALLRGPSARHAVAHPRQELMLRGVEAGLSLNQVGRYLGGRDHTTVLYGAKRAQARRDGTLSFNTGRYSDRKVEAAA